MSLGVLRANKDMLLSVLHSFVVDPLVEWKGKDKVDFSKFSCVCDVARSTSDVEKN